MQCTPPPWCAWSLSLHGRFLLARWHLSGQNVAIALFCWHPVHCTAFRTFSCCAMGTSVTLNSLYFSIIIASFQVLDFMCITIRRLLLYLRGFEEKKSSYKFRTIFCLNITVTWILGACSLSNGISCYCPITSVTCAGKWELGCDWLHQLLLLHTGAVHRRYDTALWRHFLFWAHTVCTVYNVHHFRMRGKICSEIRLETGVKIKKF